MPVFFADRKPNQSVAFVTASAVNRIWTVFLATRPTRLDGNLMALAIIIHSAKLRKFRFRGVKSRFTGDAFTRSFAGATANKHVAFAADTLFRAAPIVVAIRHIHNQRHQSNCEDD